MFMRAYQDMVYSTAARLSGDPSHAEDIAQQVFLKAWEHFDRIRGSAQAGGWLKTVTTNLSLNHLSRYRRRWRFFSEMGRAADAEDEAGELPFAVPETLLDEVEGQERQARVEAAIQQLPTHRRVPLVLYHFEAMSYQQIAEKLQISLAKVKTDISRARTALAMSLMQ